MRRNARRGGEKQNWWENKKVLTSGIAIVAVFAAAVSISLYSNQTNNDEGKNRANTNQIISLVPDDENQTNTQSESASSSIGRSIEEEEAADNTTNTANTTNEATTNTTTKSNSTNTTKSSTNTSTNKASTNTVATNAQATEAKEEVTFNWPVEGELLKAFSIDNLLYSSTLDEWVTHNGIDIKADKTSVVKASADGTVKSIKNDPRYGLTVVIDHADNYRTIYSNLLTAEFVVEGEQVTQGQTIGTVGNTATFEIADESHLHFELLKDSEYVDPTIYLK